MMRKKPTSLIFLLFLILQSCTSSKADIIEMHHYFGGVGLQLKYIVNNNLLTVKSNCDYEDCSEQLIYERKISEKESTEFISKIQLLQPDTFNKEYINNYILDGQYTEIYFGKLININKNEVIIQNVNVPVVDSIIKYIDDLIHEKRYKLKTFGQK